MSSHDTNDTEHSRVCVKDTRSTRVLHTDTMLDIVVELHLFYSSQVKPLGWREQEVGRVGDDLQAGRNQGHHDAGYHLVVAVTRHFVSTFFYSGRTRLHVQTMHTYTYTWCVCVCTLYAIHKHIQAHTYTHSLTDICSYREEPVEIPSLEPIIDKHTPKL